jgi:two-component system CheB/CheR fusion protein
LAQDQREHAIGIVLSGTGSDGAVGVRAIKSAGGLVMAQSPASAEFDGMPRSALATGVIDFELPADEMGAGLIAFSRHARMLKPSCARSPLRIWMPTLPPNPGRPTGGNCASGGGCRARPGTGTSRAG